MFGVGSCGRVASVSRRQTGAWGKGFLHTQAFVVCGFTIGCVSRERTESTIDSQIYLAMDVLYFAVDTLYLVADNFFSAPDVEASSSTCIAAIWDISCVNLSSLRNPSSTPSL